MLKICGSCEIEKDFTEFYLKNRNEHNMLASVSSDCKVCVRRKRSNYVKHRPDKCSESDRKQHLKKYNLTPEGYNALFEKQSGACIGCERHQVEFDRKLSVDHDHVSGRVRGLLCVTCNLILGYAKDDPYVLNNLIDYLVRNNSELAEQPSVVEVKFPKKVG